MTRSTLTRTLWIALSLGLLGGGFWLVVWVGATGKALEAAAPEASPLYLPGTPGAHVAAYVEGDFRGERLEGANWLKFRQMVLWPSEPDWETATVIRSYRLQSAQTTLREATLEANYDILGELDVHAFRYTHSPSRRTVAFKAMARPDGWKIGYPTVQPHVGLDAAIAHLERMAHGYPQQRPAIQKAIAALRAEAHTSERR